MSRPITQDRNHTRMLQNALNAAIATLRAAGVPEAARDARLLLRWAGGWSAAELTLALYDPAPAHVLEKFAQAVEMRAERRPVSHIIGWRAFYGRRFEIGPGALDPRPESELLVQSVLHDLKPGPARVLDLGVGSGCLLLSVLAERPEAEGLGIDASQAALAIAEKNRAALGLQARAALRIGDWLAGVEGRYDAILCNPPYIPAADIDTLEPEPRLWEPRGALTPGEDGLSVYRHLAPKIAGYLAQNGAAYFELGAGQARDVAQIMRNAGLNTRIAQDLGGVERMVCAF